MITKKAIACIVLAVGLLLAAPVLLAANSYTVSARIAHGDTLVGEPTMVARAGAPAKVTVHGENGYSLMFTVVPKEGDLLEVTIEAATSKGSVSTVTTAQIGKPVTVTSGDMGLSLTVSDAGA